MSGIERIAIQPRDLGLVPELSQASKQGLSAGKFDSILNGLLNDIGRIQQRSGPAGAQALTGPVQDIHDVLVSADAAGIGFELIVELRNKLLEAYQELMRMHV